MGAWGAGSFDNDDACDWINDLSNSKNETIIYQAIETINSSDGYIEAPECSIAIAAVEVILAIYGKSTEKFPDEIKEFIDTIESKPNRESINDAIKALSRIKTDSELKELWGENNENNQWQNNVNYMINKLKAI